MCIRDSLDVAQLDEEVPGRLGNALDARARHDRLASRQCQGQPARLEAIDRVDGLVEPFVAAPARQAPAHDRGMAHVVDQHRDGHDQDRQAIQAEQVMQEARDENAEALLAAVPPR